MGACVSHLRAFCVRSHVCLTANLPADTQNSGSRHALSGAQFVDHGVEERGNLILFTFDFLICTFDFLLSLFDFFDSLLMIISAYF